MDVNRRAFLRAFVTGAGLVAASTVVGACGVAPEGDDGGSGVIDTAAGQSLEAYTDGLLTTLVRTAELAFGMQGATAPGPSTTSDFDKLHALAEQQVPGAPLAGAYVPCSDARHPLRALVAYVREDPARPGSFVSHTLHDFGQRQPITIPTVVQIGLNRLILKSSSVRDDDQLFGIDGLDTGRLEDLRPHYMVESVRKLHGDEALHMPSAYRLMMTREDTVSVEWSPSADDPTIRSRLSLVKGPMTKDREQRRRIEGTFGLPYRAVFGGTRNATADRL